MLSHNDALPWCASCGLSRTNRAPFILDGVTLEFLHSLNNELPLSCYLHFSISLRKFSRGVHAIQLTAPQFFGHSSAADASQLSGNASLNRVTKTLYESIPFLSGRLEVVFVNLNASLLPQQPQQHAHSSGSRHLAVENCL